MVGMRRKLKLGGKQSEEKEKQEDRRGSITVRTLDAPLQRQEQALARWVQWVLQKQDEQDAVHLNSDSSASSVLKPFHSACQHVFANDAELANASIGAESVVMDGRISLNPTNSLLLDVGLREAAIESLLHSTDSRYVAAAVDLIARSHGAPANECARLGMRSCLRWHVLGGKEAESAPLASSSEHEDAMQEAAKACLRRVLVLLKLLDRTGVVGPSSDGLPPLMPPHARRTHFYEVLQDVLLPSLVGAGDIVRHLRIAASYALVCSRAVESESGGPAGQLWSDMRNSLAGALTDGLRVLKLVELLSGETALATYARRPAKKRVDRLYNAEVALHAASSAGMLQETYTKERIERAAESIVDNHRERTVAVVAELLDGGHLARVCPLKSLRGYVESARDHDTRIDLCKKFVLGAMNKKRLININRTSRSAVTSASTCNGNRTASVGNSWATVHSVRQAIACISPSMDDFAVQSCCYTSSSKTDTTNTDEDARVLESLQSSLQLPVMLAEDSSGDETAACAMLSLAMPFILHRWKLDDAASRIQRYWRKPRTVGHLHLVKQAVSLIAYRRKHQLRCRSVRILQRAARGMLARAAARRKRRAAMVLQAYIRGWLVQRHASEQIHTVSRALYRTMHEDDHTQKESIGDAAWRALRFGLARDGGNTIDTLCRACTAIGRASWLCPRTARIQLAEAGAPDALLHLVRAAFPHIDESEHVRELAHAALSALGELARCSSGADTIVSEEETFSTLSDVAHVYRQEPYIACAALNVILNAASEAGARHALRLSNTRTTVASLGTLLSKWIDMSDSQSKLQAESDYGSPKCEVQDAVMRKANEGSEDNAIQHSNAEVKGAHQCSASGCISLEQHGCWQRHMLRATQSLLRVL